MLLSACDSYNSQLRRANIWKIRFDPVEGLTIDLVSSFPMLHLTFLGTIEKSFAASALLENTFLVSLFTTGGTHLPPSINKMHDILHLLMLAAFSNH